MVINSISIFYILVCVHPHSTISLILSHTLILPLPSSLLLCLAASWSLIAFFFYITRTHYPIILTSFLSHTHPITTSLLSFFHSYIRSVSLFYSLTHAHTSIPFSVPDYNRNFMIINNGRNGYSIVELLKIKTENCKKNDQGKKRRSERKS